MASSTTPPRPDPAHAVFPAEVLARDHARGGRLYHEFLRASALSAGLYVLDAGGVDPQTPHAEDEVYVVLAGRGRFLAAEEDRAVGAGDVLYVRRGVEHRFHTITERLMVVVLFAPPEGSCASSAAVER